MLRGRAPLGARPPLSMRSSRPIITAFLAAALVVTYFGFQGGAEILGVSRGIEFRCNAVEYGVIPYEVTHPGEQLTDPYCQPQPESVTGAAEEDHHPRSDPGIVADAPTWLTPLTATFMHGGLLHLLASVLFLLAFGPPLERRIGSMRFLGLFMLAALMSTAALVAMAPSLPIPTIGAAGAVSGVIGGHLALARRTPLTPLELPAPALFAAWIVVQAAVAQADAAQPVAGAGGDIAYLAAAAGLIVGLLPVMITGRAGAAWLQVKGAR
jgi:membrane associated rhomboid family serine protease